MAKIIKDFRQLKDVPQEFDEDASIARIERYIIERPENSRIFTITPKIAAYLLKHYNTGNRPKRPGKIKSFAEQMKNGKWGLTGDTLKFSDINRLRDGQNRLEACLLANVPFRTHIVFGVLDTLFDVMDRGGTRSGSDVLNIAGIKNGL